MGSKKLARRAYYQHACMQLDDKKEGQYVEIVLVLEPDRIMRSHGDLHTLSNDQCKILRTKVEQM